MAEPPKLQQSHVILIQKEVGQHLVNGILRSQGIDPDKYTTTFTCSYRFHEGQIIAAVSLQDVVPTPPAPPSPPPVSEKT